MLEGPRVQWTAPMLHWDLPVSSSDYHLWDYYQQAMIVCDYWREIQQVHWIQHQTKMQTHAVELEIKENLDQIKKNHQEWQEIST